MKGLYQVLVVASMCGFWVSASGQAPAMPPDAAGMAWRAAAAGFPAIRSLAEAFHHPTRDFYSQPPRGELPSRETLRRSNHRAMTCVELLARHRTTLDLILAAPNECGSIAGVVSELFVVLVYGAK